MQAKVISVGFPPIPFLGSWIAAWKFMRQPLETIMEGRSKSKNGLFRIATLQGEYILVTDRHKVAEYVKAPDTILNSQDGANDASFCIEDDKDSMTDGMRLQQQQIPLTMGYSVGHRTYHTPVVRGPVIKNIESKTPIMLDEAMAAIDHYIGSPSGQSTKPYPSRLKQW